ncbi:MAG: phosphatidate cytidylyltransferase [Xanthomonadaceae bacterium]|nr:phosphatidate cytidylyltransferase [Xanthomonadaceae bacterium]
MKVELRKRITTAAIIATLLFSTLYFGGVSGTLIFISIASGLMLHEFGNIVFSLKDHQSKRIFLIIIGTLVMIFKSLEKYVFFPVFEIGFVFVSVFFLIQARLHEDEENLKTHVKEWFTSIAGITYLGLLPSFLVKLRSLEQGWSWCALLFFIVIASDTAAYFVGRKFGKTKLYPLVSPKKSLEGFVGGVLGSVLITALYSRIALQQYPLVQLLALGLVIGLIAPVGDLVESLLKRGFDVKDSGGLLPGHGGLLDRADSVVFSVPVMYAGVKLLSQGG